MFHFPWFALPTLCIQMGVPQLFAAVGFPIRKSPDQRLVGNSPKLFAATHVLHRLSAPRHPPHALSSLLTSISFTPAITAGMSKLEIEVQAPALRGGPERIITSDPLRHHDARSKENSSQQKLNSTLRMHLSKNARAKPDRLENVMELIGIEPTTSSLQSWRSPS